MRVLTEAPDLAGPGLAALEAEWRELEARSSVSFFQSWSWIGCLAGERFDAPLLIRAVQEDRTIGLALFNRHGLPLAPRALWLHQTGNPAEDSVFIEHNGPVVAKGHPAAARAILRVALREGGVVVLGGVGDMVLDAIAGLGITTTRARREAPYAMIAGQDEKAWRAGLGAATRSQLGRSQRRLERLGPLVVRRAEGVAEALGFLDELALLHQAAWVCRGQAGAFAEPAFQRFHAKLIERCLPRGEVALWRLEAGPAVVGYLYNFCWANQVMSYQSGFDTRAAPRASPGLTLHAAAITEAARTGMDRYDFLAGDARYKRSLGSAALPLHWLELASALHLRGWLSLGRCLFGMIWRTKTKAD